MESLSVGAEVQECRNIRLKLLSCKRSNLLLIHCISAEAQSGEKICSSSGLQHKKRGVRDVCRVSGMRESQGRAMGEELENLALQCLIRGEGAKVVENLTDRNFLVFFCGDC